MKILLGAVSALICALLSINPASAWRHGIAPVSYFNNGGGQINPNTGDYYVGNIKDANWWRGAAAAITIGSSGANNGLSATAAWNATGTGGLAYFNPSTGEVSNPAPADLTSIRKIVFTNTSQNPPQGVGGTPWYQGQRWDLQWCGTSVPSNPSSALGTGSTAMTIDSGSVAGCPGGVGGTAHYTFGTGAGNVFLQFTTPSSSSPPNSIFLYQHQYASAMAPCLAAPATVRNCLNPDWLSLDGSFGVMRFMPDFSTNDSGISDFSQLADYSYSTLFRNNNFQLPSGSYSSIIPAVGGNFDYGPKGGLAPSVVCDVVNRIGAHPHINFPLAANDSYPGLYANAESGCLKAGLVPRYEFCNEIWNFTGGFNCFYYANYQPWPPLGPSGPYQQAVTISSITPSVSPTTVNATAHGFSINQNICFKITSGTMASALNFQTSVASVINANSFTVNLGTSGLTFTAGTVYKCGTNVQWGGYRAAQLMQKVRTALGTDSGNGWRGVLGGQIANTGVFDLAIAGVNFFITNEAPANTTVNKLFSEIDVAPYWGNGTVDGNTISNITNAATPTISFSCNVGAQVCPTTGSKIRIYAASGMTQINNMTATITCSPCTSTGTININTSGFSAWNTANGGANAGNFFIDNTLPKMADDSIALNGSAPATYPTQYSYFSQEMSDSIVNGTATNSGYATSTVLSLTSGGIPSQFKAWALLANSYGLDLRQYEGGNGFAYFNNAGLPCYISCNTPNTFYDFLLNWRYDAGTATFGPQSIYTAAYNAYQAVNGQFPSQFLDTGGGPAPFNGTRFYPGDSTNANWAPVVAKNALGPYIDPTVGTSASCSMVASGGLPDTSPATSTSFSANIGATASPFVAVSVAQNGGTFGPPTVSVGGVALTLSESFSNAGTVSSIYTGIATGLSGSQTVSITYDASSAFRARPAFVFTTANLNSKSVLSHTSGNSSGVTLNYTKNGCIIAAGLGLNDWSASSGAATLNSATPGQAPNPTTYTSTNANAGDAVVMTSNFSSSIFSIKDGGSGGSISVIEVR